MIGSTALKEQLMWITLVKLQIPTGFFVKEVIDSANSLHRNVILHSIYVLGLVIFSIIITVAWFPLVYETAFSDPLASYLINLPLDIFVLWVTLYPDEVLVNSLLNNFFVQLIVYFISGLQILALIVGL